jgi:hypothetical protein
VVGPKPSVYAMHAMAYDPVAKKSVPSGGMDAGHSESFDDIWLYTGDGVTGTWQEAANSRSAYVAAHALVWDPDRGSIHREAGPRIPTGTPGLRREGGTESMPGTAGSGEPHSWRH